MMDRNLRAILMVATFLPSALVLLAMAWLTTQTLAWTPWALTAQALALVFLGAHWACEPDRVTAHAQRLATHVLKAREETGLTPYTRKQVAEVLDKLEGITNHDLTTLGAAVYLGQARNTLRAVLGRELEREL